MQAREDTMRCTRIEVNGYRRLATASTNIDSDITAFIGSNEAGKTSLFKALEWSNGAGALHLTAHHGLTTLPDDHNVTKVIFTLSDGDREAVSHLPLEAAPVSLTLSRKVDGSATFSISPLPAVSLEYARHLSDLLTDAHSTTKNQFDDAESEGDEPDPLDWYERVQNCLLEDRDGDWGSTGLEALIRLRDWFSSLPEDALETTREQLLASMTAAHELFDSDDDFHRRTYEVLRGRVPEFVVFTEEHRVLASGYALAPDQKGTHTLALKTLLAAASLDVDELWTSVAAGDITRRQTLLKQANRRLHGLFASAWNQSGVTVSLAVNGQRLELQIEELNDEGRVTTISERSDGLKSFVALVAFLAQNSSKVPPILLVDEAEIHLHLDAQADLVGVLFKHINARQVFYTTHSPGCLPSDLGTGVRVVKQDPKDPARSIIRHDFWQSGSPGFTPLLFAMGAGAAAFSVCRRAVLAEGASDMVLLPTLIRKATDLLDLDYQVAPGLSHLHGSGFNEGDLASRVLYLVDGDQGGETHRESLIENGVPSERVFALLDRKAVEDLIAPGEYLAAVNSLFDDMNQAHVDLTDLDLSKPIAAALTAWAKKTKTRIPSKVEVAYRLLQHDPELTPDGEKALIDLHAKFTKAFA